MAVVLRPPFITNQRGQWSSAYSGFTSSSPPTLISAVQPPSKQLDWQNPLRAPWMAYYEFAGGNRLALRVPNTEPFYQTAWPNPTPPPPYQGFTSSGLALAVPKPFSQDDWPVPTPRPLGVIYQGYTSSGLALTVPSKGPFSQGDWPNPRPIASANLGFASNNITALTAPSNPFAQRDWLNPRTQASPAYLGFTSSNFTALTGRTSKIASLDALLQETVSSTVSLDAVLQKTVSNTASLDGILSNFAINAVTSSLDAIIVPVSDAQSGIRRRVLAERARKRFSFDPFAEPTRVTVAPEVHVVVGSKERHRELIENLLDEVSPIAFTPNVVSIPASPPRGTSAARAAVIRAFAAEKDQARKDAILRQKNELEAQVAAKLEAIKEEENADDEEVLLAIFLAI